MKRFMKILLGLSIGAAVAMLFARKSGRELREQLIGGATGKLLPAAPVEFPEPEGERLWDAGTATAVAEPPIEEPVAEEPVAEEAVAEEAVAEEPVAEEPVAEEPVAEEPVAEEAVAEEPVAEEATSEDLRARIDETRAAVETDIAQPFASVAAEEAVAEEAAPEEAVVEEPVAEEVVVEEPAEELTAETPVSEGPIAEDAPVTEAAEGLVADITSSAAVAVGEETPVEAVAEVEAIEAEAVEEPIAEEPVAEEEAAAREGGTIDQAEMRRRIEETRARLKAKAFDAMMSGESALLSRDSGERPVPKGDDAKLDGELESTIDESLSQEEY
jgi:hypothetical protein